MLFSCTWSRCSLWTIAYICWAPWLLTSGGRTGHFLSISGPFPLWVARPPLCHPLRPDAELIRPRGWMSFAFHKVRFTATSSKDTVVDRMWCKWEEEKNAESERVSSVESVCFGLMCSNMKTWWWWCVCVGGEPGLMWLSGVCRPRWTWAGERAREGIRDDPRGGVTSKRADDLETERAYPVCVSSSSNSGLCGTWLRQLCALVTVHTCVATASILSLYGPLDFYFWSWCNKCVKCVCVWGRVRVRSCACVCVVLAVIPGLYCLMMSAQARR